MKNKLKVYISILFFLFLISKKVNANEPFVFDITEIEVLQDGNQINGYYGGKVTSEDGSTITAQNFFYNKLTNILETSGNVKYLDKVKNIIITTDKAIYLKNEEKIFTIGNSKVVNYNNTIKAYNLEYDKSKNTFEAKKNAVVTDFEKDTTIYADEISYLKNEEKISTKGKTKALIKNKYKFNSENVTYLRNLGDLISKKKSILEDDNGNIYKLKNFTYNIDKQLLKGVEVEILAKVDENKIDQFFFSEGFFNL
jgi:LPS-assembly protein